MPNGRPGDHPLTDLFRHNLTVYGEEIDEILRKINELLFYKEFEQWWEKEFPHSGSNNEQLHVVTKKYNSLTGKSI
jgi:hypothetical protein